ncbi:hypothetical protein [Corynebacterium sp. 13CS0277]|nr:hypothetical protein [Corynebacterium sp. 13CS0277]
MTAILTLPAAVEVEVALNLPVYVTDCPLSTWAGLCVISTVRVGASPT